MIAKNVRKRKTNLMKIKTGAGIAALVAAVAMFIVMVQVEKNVLENYEKGIVLVATHTIPKGKLITGENLSQYFTTMELDIGCIPDTAITDVEQMNGLVAQCQVEQGVVVTKGMFENLNEILQKMEEPVIAGFKADDMYQVAGGVLRSGDRIHIYTVTDGQAVLAWESVYVQQVFDSTGANISNEDDTTVAQRVNVYLEKEDVAAFYTGLAMGNLRVVKVCG